MVKGTGPEDRITSKDVETFVVSGPPPAAAAPAIAAAAAPAVAPPSMQAAAFEDIPLTNVRQVRHISTTSEVLPVCKHVDNYRLSVRWF